LLLRTWLPYDWTPRSEAYFVFPLAQGTPGKQCGLAATGVYPPSLRSPWLAANEVQFLALKLRPGKRRCSRKNKPQTKIPRRSSFASFLFFLTLL
ncbi:hypothetical protein, partial [Thiolapillus sp.]|uniref:hypothetical protein n=1 Tax=Thiolapillus sp. TaxID=2017437 RepID=UPI003AF74E32